MASFKLIAGDVTNDCLRTVKHQGEVVGKEVKIGGYDSYVSFPPGYAEGTQASKILLFFTNVFGPFFINNKLIMDYFASNGYLVLSPDYFEGDPMPLVRGNEDFDWKSWVARKFSRSHEIVPTWVEAVKSEYGGAGTKYVAVGYCFGAPAAFKYASTDLLVAAAVAHPTRLTEADFHSVKQPILLSCAEIDQAFPLEKRREAEDILISKKHTYHFQVFSSVSHGFAIRGDPKNPAERWAKEESARSILSWLEHHVRERE